MVTADINKKKHCETCDGGLTVVAVPTQILDKWICSEHGDQEKAIIHLFK